MVDILNEIKRSSKYLCYEKGWDGEDANVLNVNAYNSSLNFILLLISKIGIIETPDISICTDGSVDITFQNKNVRLLVNIKEESISWYGDNLNKLEGKINGKQKELFNKELFNWIKDNLSLNKN